MCLPKSDVGGSGPRTATASAIQASDTRTKHGTSSAESSPRRRRPSSSATDSGPSSRRNCATWTPTKYKIRAKDLVGYALVALAAFLTYHNSLRGHFVHDDIVAIVKNDDVRGDGPLLRTFANDFWGVPMRDPSSHKSYRPLTTLTFRLNAIFSAENVIGYHVVNVILHVIVSVQLADLCRRCLAWDWSTSLTAAILFATHPVHTEAVSSIVGRAELLCSTFFLLGLTIFIRSGRVRSGGQLAIVCGCAFCSMLAKEQGVTLLLVCLTYDLVRRTGNRWKRRRSVESLIQISLDRSSLTLIASLAMMVGFRLWILQGSMPVFSDQDNPASHSSRLLTRLLTYLYLPACNAWLLLCPLTLAYDWQLGSIPLVTGLADPRNLASLAAYVTLSVLFWKLWTVPKNSTKEELTIGLCVLTIPFLPAANVFFPVGFVVAERILYTPSIGYCILIASGLREICRRRSRSATCLIRSVTTILVALLWLRSVRRNEDWTNRETLFRSGLRSTPDNAKVHYNFANLQKDNGQTELAVEHYRKALSLWPNYVSAHNNLGTLLVNPEEAEFHFQRAMNLDPKHARAHYNLAALYRRSRQPELVIWLLNRAIELDPDLDEAYTLLTSVYADKKKTTVSESGVSRATAISTVSDKGTGRSQRLKNRSSDSEGVINQTAGSANRPTRSSLLYQMTVGRDTDHVIKR